MSDEVRDDVREEVSNDVLEKRPLTTSLGVVEVLFFFWVRGTEEWS